MTWKGICPVVDVVENIYEKGVIAGKKIFKAINNRIDRDKLRPKYFVTIHPQENSG